jgi:hypothetical protein
MQKVGLKSAKIFKNENEDDTKYDRIRRFYEIRKGIQNTLGDKANGISPEQVLVSLCNLKPDAKSFNQFATPVLNK